MNDKSELEKTERLYNDIDNLIKPKAKPSSDKRKIDETLFWKLIDDYRTLTNDKFDFIEKLSSKLEEFKPSEIRKFERIFRTKYEELNLGQLWALAYIVRRGCGDDAFDYFKAWVISKGQMHLTPFQKCSLMNLSSILMKILNLKKCCIWLKMYMNSKLENL